MTNYTIPLRIHNIAPAHSIITHGGSVPLNRFHGFDAIKQLRAYYRPPYCNVSGPIFSKWAYHMDSLYYGPT